MIKVKKVFEKEYYQREREVMELFGYQILDVKEKKNTMVVRAQIDENDSKYFTKYDYYQKVSRWTVRPLWPLLACAGLSFALVTVLLIIYLCNKSDPNMFIYIMSIGVPAALFLLAAVIYSGIKFKADTHNLQPLDDIDEIKRQLEKMK